VQERERRDVFVRRASLDRFQKTLAPELGEAERTPIKGFDLAWVSKARIFPRRAAQRVLARFIDRVDAAAIAETFALAARSGSEWTDDELCVFLLGGNVAASRELADAVAEQRKRPPRGVAGRITVVPIDVRDWSALVPQDAPDFARAVAKRIKER
jgi:hypothetical protein